MSFISDIKWFGFLFLIVGNSSVVTGDTKSFLSFAKSVSIITSLMHECLFVHIFLLISDMYMYYVINISTETNQVTPLQ